MNLVALSGKKSKAALPDVHVTNLSVVLLPPSAVKRVEIERFSLVRTGIALHVCDVSFFCPVPPHKIGFRWIQIYFEHE